MKFDNLPVIYEGVGIGGARFFSLSVYHLKEDIAKYLHYHDVLELGFCLSGCGKCMLNNECIPYKAGDVQVILPYQPHYDVLDEKNTVWLFISIDINKIFSPHVSTDPVYFVELLQKTNSSGIFDKEKHPTINQRITRIAQLVQSDDPRHNEVLDLITAELIALITELFLMETSDENAPVRIKKSQSILPAMQVVSTAINNKIQPTPKMMAEACFMSESYFRKVFSQIMDEAPKAYIMRMQMNKAADLISSSSVSISTVASDCGFSDNTTFYRCFKRVYGISPYKYRNKK